MTISNPLDGRKRLRATAIGVPLLLFLFGALAPAQAADLYILDFNSSKSIYNANHLRRLLTAALDASRATYGDYELRVAELRMERERLLIEMVRGELVNLSAQATTSEWERELIPIRIPVDKGISSYRISLIDGRQQAQLSAIKTLGELKKLSLGAGKQWGSTAVLRRAGFNVKESNSTIGLHSMLAAGRFQHFPRALDEAVFEQARYSAQFPDLRVEGSFAIHFPLPRYFFVGGNQRRLAQRLAFGLQRVVENGEYDQIFHEFYDPLIQQIALARRRIFRIPNPLLPPQTPLDTAIYWYDPFRHPSR